MLTLSSILQGGFHVFTVIDQRLTTSHLLINLLQLICVVWFYGVNNLMDNIKEMGMPMPR